MKYVKPLFCLEILFVLVGCTRVYMKWDLPLYVPILIGTIAVALLYYFHFQQTKIEKSSSMQYRRVRNEKNLYVVFVSDNSILSCNRVQYEEGKGRYELRKGTKG